MKTRDLIVAVRRHHQRMNDPWVVLTEAFGIDMLAICQSRGSGRQPQYRRISYELKASRADFRRELDRWPMKAASGLEMGHAYVFVTPAGLLSDNERKRRHPPTGPVRGQQQLAEVLSTRGKRDALYVPEPAGLMEVDADGVCRMRVRPAWRHDARAWDHGDVAYLAAYAWRPGVIATAEWRKLDYEQKIRELERVLQSAQQAHDEARKALRDVAHLHVQPGQRWRIDGQWAPPLPTYGPPREGRTGLWATHTTGPVDCEVVDICPDEYFETRARLRRLDTGHEHDRDRFSGIDCSELLIRGERLDGPVAATVTDLAARRRA